MTRLGSGACLLALLFACIPAFAKDAVPPKLLLWPTGAPGANADGGEEKVRIAEKGDHVVSNVHKPSITVYLPKHNASGAAVIVIPGGGHRELWSDHEGHNVARYLNEQGVAAFVVFYRLAREPDSKYSIEGDALGDVQRAIRTVRTRAAEWSLRPDRIGIMGFSAGGQLAELASTRFDAGAAAAADPIDRAGSRPDFAALVYPGVWKDLKITATTPPMFLLCGSDDRPEVISVLTQVYLSLREAKVPAELHLYDGVGHGFGLRADNKGPVAQWPRQFVDWMRVEKILGEKP